MKPVSINNNKNSGGSSTNNAYAASSFNSNQNFNLMSGGSSQLASTSDETSGAGLEEADATGSQQENSDQADASRHLDNNSPTSLNILLASSSSTSSLTILSNNDAILPVHTGKPQDKQEFIEEEDRLVKSPVVASSTEIASTSCGVTTVTFDISSASTVSSPLSSDDEDQECNKKGNFCLKIFFHHTKKISIII